MLRQATCKLRTSPCSLKSQPGTTLLREQVECRSLKARKSSSLKFPCRTHRLMQQRKRKTRHRKKIKTHHRRKLQNLPRSLRIRRKSNPIRRRMRKLLLQRRVRSASSRAKQNLKRPLPRPRVARMSKLPSQPLQSEHQTLCNHGSILETQLQEYRKSKLSNFKCHVTFDF